MRYFFSSAEREKREKKLCYKGLYARLHATIRNDAENEKQKKKKKHNDEALYVCIYHIMCYV